MTNKLFGTSLVIIIAVSSVSCSSGITGAQDIDRTQPDKIESVGDTPSDPDTLTSATDTSSSSTAERPFRYY